MYPWGHDTADVIAYHFALLYQPAFIPDDVTGAVSVETGSGAADWTVNLRGICAGCACCSS